MALVDGDAIHAERAGERQSIGASRRRHVPDVDGPAGVGQGSQPTHGYIVNFVWMHERGFTAPVSRFMQGLCQHYRVSQAACFITVCERYLGIPANWDLWVHLFRAELHTLTTGEARTHRAVRTSVMTLTLQDMRKELYPPCTMTSKNADYEKGWFYLRNDGADLPPYTGKVLMAKTNTWHHGVSPPAWQQRLESLTTSLRCLADAGLGAASIIANFHHWRIVPLMERELFIFEMSNVANPVSLACSQLLQEHFPKEYAATRARCAINLKSLSHSDDDLWSFVMLPNTKPVSAVSLFPSGPYIAFLFVLTTSACNW
jgi:hypothetical protein